MFMLHKALHSLVRVYLPTLLEVYYPDAAPKLADRELLVVPEARPLTLGDRAFCVSAPKMWNEQQI